jgi:hypothetical protein
VERANGTFQDRLVSELRLAGASSVEETNRVLGEFLPRFNRRFGVPAAQPGSAYREVPEELDIDGVLCIKELRRVAKDNTVQYHGKTLQLFPDVDRTSYARARVEVQERLDGSLAVCHRGKLLTPVEAPPLAAELRRQAEAAPVLPVDPWPPEPVRERRKSPKTGLGWEGEWYQDESKRRTHRELVKAGMERARQRGTPIGRPRVMDREGFPLRFEAILERIRSGEISRRKAAQQLDIGYATLKRLLDALPKPPPAPAAGTDIHKEVLFYAHSPSLTESLNT